MQAVRWRPLIRVCGYLAIWLGTIALLMACASSAVDVPPVPPEAQSDEQRDSPPRPLYTSDAADDLTPVHIDCCPRP